MLLLSPNQCDQIVRFFKVLGDMVSIKSSPNAWWILGLKWKATLFMLNYCNFFLGNIWKKICYFLIHRHLVTLLPTLTWSKDWMIIAWAIVLLIFLQSALGRWGKCRQMTRWNYAAAHSSGDTFSNALPIFRRAIPT